MVDVLLRRSLEGYSNPTASRPSYLLMTTAVWLPSLH